MLDYYRPLRSRMGNYLLRLLLSSLHWRGLLSNCIPNCTPFGEQRHKSAYQKWKKYCLSLTSGTAWTFRLLLMRTLNRILSPFRHVFLVSIQRLHRRNNLYRLSFMMTTIELKSNFFGFVLHKQNHVPSRLCYAIVYHNQKLSEPPIVYRGSNAVDIFLVHWTKRLKRWLTLWNLLFQSIWQTPTTLPQRVTCVNFRWQKTIKCVIIAS